ncbi:hypothetical protein DIPPA_21049 [Diplonema papillatum]|nr:hypothetical protein DIPPA_21049 [Diplonema papillatum]
MPAPAKKILYLHGFSEGPSNPKPAYLQQKYGITMPALGMYPTKRNSPVLLGLTGRWSAACMAGAAAAAAVPWLLYGWSGAAALGAWLGAYVAGVLCLRRRVVAEGVRRSYEKTLRIARAAIEKEAPDLLVGFSWGGALAVHCLLDGTYAGPCLLLAPAYQKLLLLQGGELPFAQSSGTPSSRVLILHCPDDPITPVADSRELADLLPNCALRVVPPGQGHRLLGTIEDGTLSEAVDEMLL